MAERDINKAPNLKNTDPELYRLLSFYHINQRYLAEKVLAEDWNKVTKGEDEYKRLVGRFRNKVLGFGKLYPNEYANLQQALSEIADDIRHTVDESIAKRTLERKEKIQRLLENLDDEELNDLLKDR